MSTRPKDPARVRVDALHIASRKLAQGCNPCADAYADLARRNGASEEEIRGIYTSGGHPAKLAAVSGFFGPSSRGLNRRLQPDLERNATRSSAPISAEQRIRSISTSSAGSIDPFGTDSNTSPSLNSLLTDFYIGKLGFGLKIDKKFFNTAAAIEAGPNFTYGYWGLVGPNNKPPNVRTNHDWGVRQAQKAIEAKTTGPNAQYVGGQTIFADVETGFGGWGTSPQSAVQQSANQEVLNGFLDHIVSLGGSVGIYIPALEINGGPEPGQNTRIFGPNYIPSRPFVLWIAGKTCGLSICDPAAGCVPCQAGCDPRTTVQNNWNNIVGHACWAGQGAVIWQFWISGCPSTPPCPGDFNYSPQSGFQFFTPAPCTATPCLVAAPLWAVVKARGNLPVENISTSINRFVDTAPSGRIFIHWPGNATNDPHHNVAYSDNGGDLWSETEVFWEAESLGGIVTLTDNSLVILTRRAINQRDINHYRWDGTAWTGPTLVYSIASPKVVTNPRPAHARNHSGVSVAWGEGTLGGSDNVIKWAPVTTSGLGAVEEAVGTADAGGIVQTVTHYYNESHEPVILWSAGSSQPLGRKRVRSGGTWGPITSFDTTDLTIPDSLMLKSNALGYSASLRSNGDIHGFEAHAGGAEFDFNYRRRESGVWTEDVLDLSSQITGSDSTSLSMHCTPILVGSRLMLIIRAGSTTANSIWFAYKDV